MKTSDFNYDLPPERIAQTPVEPRDSSRLLVLDRINDRVEHTIFRELSRYLQLGDLLVLNQTRVIPARIYAKKASGGRVELLLLNRRSEDTWEALVGGKGIKEGRRLSIQGGPGVVVTKVLEGPRRLVQFDEPVEAYLSEIGQMPLPPYIHEKLKDPERYQTVYAKQSGSAAAPTAGLHFTSELLSKLESEGIQFANLTLHVGLDTFAPVTEDDPLEHKIHTEWCELDQKAAAAVNNTKQRGSRVIAVGTTSVRTLESAHRKAQQGETVGAFTGPTDLFILPGYTFRVVDAMITNFHLPKSTLLMLVSAFAGRQRILETYAQAVRMNYRFYSFGDAMLIL